MKVSCCCFCVNIGIVLIFKIVCRFSLVFGGGDVYGRNDGQGELDDGPGGPDKEIEISSGGRKGFEGRCLVAAVGLLAAEEGFMAAGRGGFDGAQGGFKGSQGGFYGGRGGFDSGRGGLEGCGGNT